MPPANLNARRSQGPVLAVGPVRSTPQGREQPFAERLPCHTKYCPMVGRGLLGEKREEEKLKLGLGKLRCWCCYLLGRFCSLAASFLRFPPQITTQTLPPTFRCSSSILFLALESFRYSTYNPIQSHRHISSLVLPFTFHNSGRQVFQLACRERAFPIQSLATPE